MRRVLRSAACALAICLAAVLLLPLVVHMYLDLAQRVEVDRFYRGRPLLSALRSAVGDSWAASSGPARQVLLQHVALGTEREAAIAVLSAEGFACTPPARHGDGSSPTADGAERTESKAAPVICELMAPTNVRLLVFAGWSITLWFDGSGRLRDADVGVRELIS